MSCSKCHKDKPIVNKKYNLCDDCNYERLHRGQSKGEVYSARAALRLKKVYQLKRSTKPIRQQTKGEQIIKGKLSTVKTNIELEAVQNDLYYCKGCGYSHPGLDKSHILSVKQRKDLELEKENIDLLCRECHMDWESWDILRMGNLNCFERYVEYISRMDNETYNKITTKIEEYMLWEPAENETVRRFKNILKIYYKTVA